MHDLDTRLERLAAEATRETVPPEVEAIARRGRRRRRRQVAGTAALVAAVVAAGLVLPARLLPRNDPGAICGGVADAHIEFLTCVAGRYRSLPTLLLATPLLGSEPIDIL